MVLLAVGLFVLWQGAAGDDEPREDEAVGSATGDDAVDAETDDDPGVTESAAAVTPEAVAELEAALAGAQADQLSLEAQLAAMSPPAPGRRDASGCGCRRRELCERGFPERCRHRPVRRLRRTDPATNAITATAQVASGRPGSCAPILRSGLRTMPTMRLCGSIRLPARSGRRLRSRA